MVLVELGMYTRSLYTAFPDFDTWRELFEVDWNKNETTASLFLHEAVYLKREMMRGLALLQL